MICFAIHININTLHKNSKFVQICIDDANVQKYFYTRPLFAHYFHHISIAHSPRLRRTNSGRCTIYVQYLYNICTFTNCTNIVQVLYIYCTTTGVGPVKTLSRTRVKPDNQAYSQKAKKFSVFSVGIVFFMYLCVADFFRTKSYYINTHFFTEKEQ